MISIRDLPNVQQNFDGFRLVVSPALWQFHALALKSSESNLGIFDDSADVRRSAATVAPFLAAGWLAAIALFGGYRSDVFGAGTDELRRTFRAGASAAALVGVGCYLAKYQLSRGFFVLAFVLVFIAHKLGLL